MYQGIFVVVRVSYEVGYGGQERPRRSLGRVDQTQAALPNRFREVLSAILLRVDTLSK